MMDSTLLVVTNGVVRRLLPDGVEDPERVPTRYLFPRLDCAPRPLPTPAPRQGRSLEGDDGAGGCAQDARQPGREARQRSGKGELRTRFAHPTAQLGVPA